MILLLLLGTGFCVLGKSAEIVGKMIPDAREQLCMEW